MESLSSDGATPRGLRLHVHGRIELAHDKVTLAGGVFEQFAVKDGATICARIRWTRFSAGGNFSEWSRAERSSSGRLAEITQSLSGGSVSSRQSALSKS
jgi:hypothetical protein